MNRLGLQGGTVEEQERLMRREKRYREEIAEIERRAAGQEEDEEEEEEEDDDEVLNRYRARRLAELKGENVPAAVSKKLGGWKEGGSGAAHFGHLRETDERGYVRAVEGTGDGDLEAKAVVVHIYSKVS